MNKSILLRTYVASALLCLTLFASCSADDDTALPEGKYPMTFATAMEGLTQTRATTDNTWEGDEKIAVQVGGEVKEYKLTGGNPATLTGVDAANTFYWQKAEETVSAWYSGAGYTAQLSSFSVKTDQSTVGYRQSDFLYAKPQDITYSSRTTNQLTFEHLPAKVIVHLKNGNGVTAKEVEDATVRIVSQETTSGMINADGTVVQITNSGTGAITPNVLSAPESGFQKSVQAIVVPQKVTAKTTKFIKVTIDKGTDAERDYYYTPENDNDVNLECGKQYTYDITVTKGEELEVTKQTEVFWKDVEAQSGSVEPAVSFNVTCPGNGVDGFKISDVTLSGDKYTVGLNQDITISYTATSNLRCYLVQGIAQISTATSGTDITHTVSGIRGDLVFSFEECPKVGDYYYADGTWSSDYPSGSSSAACIGIVFKVDAGTGDDASYYDGKLLKGIRGYVVALEDVNESERCAWGGDNVPVGTSTNQEDYLGYSNSRKIVAKANEGGHLKPEDDVNDYPAMYYISTYGNSVPAPSNSSGWYFPSTGQLYDIYQARGSIQDKVTTAKGTWFNLGNSSVTVETLISDYYLSSSEYNDRGYPSYNVGSFSFGTGITYWREKDSEPAYVRAILTF